MSKKNIIENLLLRPRKEKRDEVPKFIVTKPNYVHQADVLFMPDDNGYKYILVVIDDSSKLVDAVALKTHSSDEVAKAFGTIYTKHKILQVPKARIEVDSGSEFKGKTLTYFKNKKVHMRVAMTDRHRQQGLVERANQTIQKLLFKKMTAIEILTDEKNTEWVDELPNIIKQMNEIASKRKKPVLSSSPLGKGEVLRVGQKVRVKLDHPIENINDKRVYGKFRVTDIRWNREPRTIMRVLIKPAYPIMYLLDDSKDKTKEERVARTRKQLQLIPDKEIYPNAKELLKDKAPKQYLVEKIIDNKMMKGELYLLVKWAGYSSKHNTYEPAKQLVKDIPDKVKQYIKEHIKN